MYISPHNAMRPCVCVCARAVCGRVRVCVCACVCVCVCAYTTPTTTHKAHRRRECCAVCQHTHTHTHTLFGLWALHVQECGSVRAREREAASKQCCCVLARARVGVCAAPIRVAHSSRLGHGNNAGCDCDGSVPRAFLLRFWIFGTILTLEREEQGHGVAQQTETPSVRQCEHGRTGPGRAHRWATCDGCPSGCARWRCAGRGKQRREGKQDARTCRAYTHRPRARPRARRHTVAMGSSRSSTAGRQRTAGSVRPAPRVHRTAPPLCDSHSARGSLPSVS